MVDWILILAVIGFVLSVYAFYVRKKTLRDKKYKALCDFNDKFVCSEVLSSKEGAVVGISNSVMGVLYYGIILFLTIGGGWPSELKFISGVGVLASIYLAFTLLTRVKKSCLLCISSYLINVLIFIFALRL